MVKEAKYTFESIRYPGLIKGLREGQWYASPALAEGLIAGDLVVVRFADGLLAGDRIINRRWNVSFNLVNKKEEESLGEETMELSRGYLLRLYSPEELLLYLRATLKANSSKRINLKSFPKSRLQFEIASSVTIGRLRTEEFSAAELI